MSDKLLCPFCQQELEIWSKYTDGTSKVWCSKCNLFGDSKLFEELITTREALDVAVGALKNVQKNSPENYTATQAVFLLAKNSVFVNNALEQINEITKKE